MTKYYFQKFAITFSIIVALVGSAFAQQRVLTREDYARAERFMNYNTTPLVDRTGIRPTWLADERFWFRLSTGQTSEFVLINPATGERRPAFDHAKLAAALSTAAGATFNATQLPFTDFTFSPDGQTISFTAANRRWKCDVQGNQCAPETPQPGGQSRNFNEILSPDGKRAVFIRDWNLWMRDVATGKETQLTTDGVKDYGYATDNAGWRKSDRPIVHWSPDSRKIATYRQDQRNVGEMYLVSTNVGHPRLQAWKYPLVGDEHIIMIERIIIEVDNPKIIRLQIPPDARRGTLCDDISCTGKLDDTEWNADASQLAFVSTSRDHKSAKFRIANAATGAVREVFEETVKTQYESGRGSINWRFLPASNEIVWFSERDDWGHLYLYDLTTGKLKQQITKGNWTITQLVRVDEKNRVLYFIAGGREAGRNPYFSHLYRVGFDGNNLQLLTPEDGNHSVVWSPTQRYFVDTYSQPNMPPVTVLRDIEGKLLATIEKTDISRLTATGWKAPEVITVKARDGVTDLYGLLFMPTNLDPNKKYPIVNYIYPGPQGGSVGSWSFSPARSDHQALAELGFVVVLIEGTCNPRRSKSFHDACYGNMADNTLPDQISGMRQLAQKYPFIDLERVGIWGHSGGGYATAMAMFRYPDFFKVGVSQAGNHDNRNYEDDWGERYIGLEVKDASGKSNYEDQATQVHAKNLRGKLMLAHGMMDDNVPPYNTLLVVDALVKANKDFDLILFPHARHGFGSDNLYMTRRRWDYFVRHLLNAEPPKDYELKPPAQTR
jgi:dipeptidyl-peptidase 4